MDVNDLADFADLEAWSLRQWGEAALGDDRSDARAVRLWAAVERTVHASPL